MLNSHYRLIDLRRFCALSSGLVLWLGAMSASPAATRKAKTQTKKTPSHSVKGTQPSGGSSTADALAPTGHTGSGSARASISRCPDQTSDESILYQGFAPEEAGITLTSIGVGDGSDNSEYALLNHHSIQVKTVDYYQGARITFNKPQILPSANDGKNHLIMLRLRFCFSNTGGILPIATQIAPRFALSLASGQARFRLAQGAPPGFPGGPRFPAGPGGPGGPNFPPGFDPNAGQPPSIPTQSSAPETFPLKTLRLVFTLANGASYDIPAHGSAALRDSGGNTSSWIHISVPVIALKFPAGSETSPLQSISIGADTNGTFYIGQIKIVQDTTPLTCFAGDNQDVARGDVVALHATGEGGASMLHYSWDFDASDGITEEASGPDVTTQYIKGSQDYKVTLTVTDVDGIKAPVTSTLTVKVED